MKRGRISPELLRKIKDSVSILDVVGEHVVLRKSGANSVGLCPFHSERSPSFSVSETKQLYHCYGCKRGGDLVTFVMEMLGVSFPEAIEDLADRARISLPRGWDGATLEGEQRDNARREKLALAYKLNRFAAAFFHQSLAHSPANQSYFKTRGIGPEWTKSFYLGSAPHSWDALSQHLYSKKAPLDVAVELGLIRPSTKQGRNEGGIGYFDLFRNRVVFPIVNLRGKIAGFGGRVLDSEDNPKYLNSPDSLIFQKGKLAFGLFQAQKFVRELDEVIVVEGYFDVLAMHAAGFRNVVATCGTALTADHLNFLKRLTQRVVLLFDGDDAGQSATLRAMELGLDQGAVLCGARLPKDQDPDELVLQPNGTEQMTSILKEAKPLLDGAIEEALGLADRSPEDRVQALKKVGAWLGRFADPVGREVRLQLIQKRLGISRGLILETLGKGTGSVVQAKKPNKTEAKIELKNPRSVLPLSQADRMVLGGLVYGLVVGGGYFEIFSEVKAQLPLGVGAHELFIHPDARSLVARILVEPGFFERLRSNPDTLLEGDMDIQIRSVITEALLWAEPPFPPPDFRIAVFKSLAKVWARFSQQIKKSISEAELNKDMELQVQLMKDYLDVQRKMKDFSNFYDQE